VGKKVLQLNPELSTVPLLDPITHCLPFAAALQIYSSVAGARSSSSSRGAACTSDSRQEQLSSSSGSLVELHYVISGTRPHVDTARLALKFACPLQTRHACDNLCVTWAVFLIP
jgi:hypothetical protein